LDQDITKLLVPRNAEHVHRSRHGWSFIVSGSGKGVEWLENQPYTASLDAAIALVPEGHEWLRKNPESMTVYRVPDDLKEWAQHIYGRGATLALALCAAALRARAAIGLSRNA
jgi:hypothetical protein